MYLATLVIILCFLYRSIRMDLKLSEGKKQEQFMKSNFFYSIT